MRALGFLRGLARGRGRSGARVLGALTLVLLCVAGVCGPAALAVPGAAGDAGPETTPGSVAVSADENHREGSLDTETPETLPRAETEAGTDPEAHSDTGALRQPQTAPPKLHTVTPEAESEAPENGADDGAAAEPVGATLRSASTLEPFDSTQPYIVVMQGRPSTALVLNRHGAGKLTAQAQFAGTKPFSINAIGYNVLDGYLYGIRGPNVPGGQVGRGTNELVRVGQNNQVEELGVPSIDPAWAGDGTLKELGLPVEGGRNSYTQGTFGSEDPSPGNPGSRHLLYIRDFEAPFGRHRMWEINVEAMTARRMTLQDNGVSLYFEAGDITSMGGYIWAYQTGSMIRMRVEPDSEHVESKVFTGVVQAMGAQLTGANQGIAPNYGSSWTFGNGDLGFQENNTGEVFRVRITNPGTTPTFSIVARYPGTLGASNDGTYIPGVPTDLGVTATAPAYYGPGREYTVTGSVTNHGPGVSSGSVVTANIPAWILNPSSSTPGCAISAQRVLTCVISELEVGQSATFQFSGQITAALPADAGDLVTELRLAGNEADGVPANDVALPVSARGTEHLDIHFAADVLGDTPLDPGAVVTYTLSVANTGTLSVQADVVNDTGEVSDDAVPFGTPQSARLMAAPLTSGGNGQLESVRLTGLLLPGETGSYSYTVRVRDTLTPPANSVLKNQVYPWGGSPAEAGVCPAGRCTQHRVWGSLRWRAVAADQSATVLAWTEWRITPVAGTQMLEAPRTVTDCVAGNASLCAAGGDQDPAAGVFFLPRMEHGDYELANVRAAPGYLQCDLRTVRIAGTETLDDFVSQQRVAPSLPLTGGVGADWFTWITVVCASVALGAVWVQRRSRVRRGR